MKGGRLDAREWGGGVEGWGWFADLVLAVTEEKQTDLTVTNEPSPVPPLTVSSLSDSFTPLQLRATFLEPSSHRDSSPFQTQFFLTLPFNFLASQLSYLWSI